MKVFSFKRFVRLLVYALETGFFAALALCWLDGLLDWWYRAPVLAGAIVHTTTNFAFLALLFLLPANLCLLLARQRRVVSVMLRIVLYFIALELSSYRLGESNWKTAESLARCHAAKLVSNRIPVFNSQPCQPNQRPLMTI